MEAQLHKLKVTDLKELLAKHSLPQTGKKDDLVKRLLENNISSDEVLLKDEATDAPTDGTSVPTSLPEVTAAPAAPVTSVIDSVISAIAPSTSSPAPAAEPAVAVDSVPGPSTEEPELTPDQKAMKTRAERFGLPFNLPKPTETPKSKPSLVADVAAKKSETKKAGSIDKNPLGISDDVLAKRAAKFGVPEKKEEVKKSEKKEAKAEEIDPELAAKVAIEEEKKRKRAEKFGPAKPAVSDTTNGITEPEAKKVKA